MLISFAVGAWSTFSMNTVISVVSIVFCDFVCVVWWLLSVASTFFPAHFCVTSL